MNEKVYNLETEKLFKQLEEAGWHPMWCDTKIDVYDNAVNCGTPEDVGDITWDVELYPSEIMPPHRIFKVPAKGDSMRDAGIQAGDMLTIETCVNIVDDDMVMVYVDGEFMVKAFYEDDDGSKWLVPYNDKYKPTKLGEQQVYISGKVIEISKRYPKVKHRDSSSIVRKAKSKQAKPVDITPLRLSQVIRAVAPMIKIGRQWYAVYRVLVDYVVVSEDDFDGFIDIIVTEVPKHEHLPKRSELMRMAVQSFAKTVKHWRPDYAPVKGKRYKDYVKIAQRTEELLLAK